MSEDVQGFAIGRLSVDLDTEPVRRIRQFGATLDRMKNSPIFVDSYALQLRLWRWNLMVMWR